MYDELYIQWVKTHKGFMRWCMNMNISIFQENTVPYELKFIGSLCNQHNFWTHKTEA
jgi:hypothetical protein